MFNMFAGGAVRPHGDLCAQYHALHLVLDHHSADDHGVAVRSRRSRRRAKSGPQDAQPIHALPDGVTGGYPSLWHRDRPRGLRSWRSADGACSSASRPRDHACPAARCSCSRGSASRSRARRRQRHFAYHLLRHRRANCRRPRRTLELGREGALSTPSHPLPGGRCRSVVRFIVLHGAAQRRLLMHIQTPGRQPHVRRLDPRTCRSSSIPRASFRRSSPLRCCCCRPPWLTSARSDSRLAHRHHRAFRPRATAVPRALRGDDRLLHALSTRRLSSIRRDRRI